MYKAFLKKKFSSDWVTTIILVIFGSYMLYNRFPAWQAAFQLEGQSPQITEVKTLLGQTVKIPDEIRKPAILIFWASWCAPCKIEMARYEKAIAEKEIPAEGVYAINLGEDLQVVKAVQKEKEYHFQILLDDSGVASQFYNVSTTPTVVHLDREGKIAWVGLGVSPTGIFRAKKLFQ